MLAKPAKFLAQQQSGPIPVVQPGDHSCANSRWKCVSFCFRCSTPGFVTRRATHARGELEPTDIDPLRNKSEKEFHRDRPSYYSQA